MQTRRWLSPVLIVTSLVCAYALGAHGSGVPATGALAYAGTLAMGDAPINATAYSIAVSLWDVEIGGVVVTNRKCDTGTLTTSVSQGHFHVVLPADCALAVAAQPDLWVEVTAAGNVLSPRVKVRSVPFAIEGAHAMTADAAASGGALATTLNAKADVAALDALVARVAALEARTTITVVDRIAATTSDVGYQDCLNSTGIFSVGACARLAYGVCVSHGYRHGWFEGNILAGNIGLACIR